MATSGIDIRLLLPGDDRSRFTSGDERLDRYFRLYAGQHQFRQRIGANYIALKDGVIVGYATVSPGHLEADHLPAAAARKLPAYPLPILRLARLATVQALHGRGVGLALLRHVLQLAFALRRDFGCIGVVVDAKPEAREFYERFGFVRLTAAVAHDQGSPLPMFIALGSISARID